MQSLLLFMRASVTKLLDALLRHSSHDWGSLTAITRNDRTPNYAFRVTARDEQADEFLAQYAVAVVGAHRPGI